MAVGGNDETLELPKGDRVGDSDVPRTVGRFVVRGVLGSGGMGIVLDGYDADLGRRVALKLVRAEANVPAYRARLLREAAAMAHIEHPNVVRVYEVGSERDRVFVAMELIEGTNLRTWLEERHSKREIMDMFAQAGAGLAAVHAGGLVHRDFKPDNVLVDRGGRARVADFGLARLDREVSDVSSPALAASLTRTGVMMGTPGYIAPEQQLGSEVDARADQYSFCVALREALAGSLKSGSDGKWGDTPAAIRGIIARGLSYDPDERFASMSELLAALARAHRRPRRVILAASAALVLVAAGGGAAVMTLRRGDEPAAVAPAPGSGSAAMPAPAPAPREVTPHDEAPSVVDVGSAGSSSGSAKVAAPVKVAAGGVKPAPVRAPSVPPPPSRNAPADAGVVAGHHELAPGEYVMLLPPAGATDQTPTKSETHEMVREHQAAVRAAVANLGFAGVTFTGNDLPGDAKQLRDQLEALEDDAYNQRLELATALGITERKRGDCNAATEAFGAAIAALRSAAIDKKAERTAGRAKLNLALCQLAAGHAVSAKGWLIDANLHFQSAGHVTPAALAEVLLARGIAWYETGSPPAAGHDFAIVQRDGDTATRAALTTWAHAVGAPL